MANEDKMNAIKNCTETQKGIDLIIAHGNTTQTNISPLYFVPAIEVDNVSLLEIYQLNLKKTIKTTHFCLTGVQSR